MSICLYVGNLPFGLQEAELLAVFAQVGEVESVSLFRNDLQLDRRRVFGFVKMPDDDALNAVGTLNGALFQGRPLIVKPTKPRPRSPLAQFFRDLKNKNLSSPVPGDRLSYRETELDLE
ncbi:MAG: RNA-binding protein [Deltaproteobacteria bacterium]|jgi:RNA recognition motif-containing protein|nr:RNA-binding protein [Deltaproteobacteria bacterium]